jgi:AcrR family transcriptional regulator
MTERELPAHMLRGQQTRDRVLGLAVEIARSEGLEALTIGRVAGINSITKAGLLGHFPSKIELQLATIDAGRQAFFAAVVAPALERPAGTERLGTLLRLWIDHVANKDGGCLFASIAAEFDSKPGVVRDRIAGLMREWLGALGRMVEEAKALGDLVATTDAQQLAFELHGHELSMNLQVQLLGEAIATARAAEAMRSSIEARATRRGKLALAKGWELSR